MAVRTPGKLSVDDQRIYILSDWDDATGQAAEYRVRRASPSTMRPVSGRDNTDAKAKAIADVKKELVIVIVGLVIAAAVVLIGGSGGLRVLRWVIALLVLVLVVAARILRRRRSREHDATPGSMPEDAEEVWQREEGRYKAQKQRERS